MKFSVDHIIIFFFLFLVILNPLHSQNNAVNVQIEILGNKADSLYKQGTRNDKKGNYKQSIIEFKKALNLYKKINDIDGIADSYSYMAIMYTLTGKYTHAIETYEKAKETYKKTENQKGLALVSHNLGKIYYLLGDYSKSLNYLKKALSIQVKLNDQHDMALIIQNIGIIYSDVNNFDEALKNYQKANKIFVKLKDSSSLPRSFNNIAIIHIEQGNYEKAHSLLLKAISIAERQKVRHSKMEILYSLGKLFYNKSNYKKGISYYRLSLQHAKELNSVYYQTLSQIAIGKIQNRLGQYQQAIRICSKGLDMAIALNSNSLKKEAYTCLYKAYKSIDNSSRALAFYEKAAIFEDSLKIEEASYQLMNMEMQNKALSDSLTYVKKKHTLQLKHQAEVQRKNTQRNIIIGSLIFVLVVAGGLWRSLKFVRKSGKALQKEKDRSENLLLNILPEEVAEELKTKGESEARLHEEVSVIFTDFVNFTQTSQKLGVKKLLKELNIYFTAFDEIMERHELEKIKTIGDAYLAVCGLPKPNENHAAHTVAAAFDILAFIEKRKEESPYALDIRIGINSGPIIAGIIGVKKFAYDIWGDTVNTAARMEQSSATGKINITENTYQLIKEEYDCEVRGKVEAKGKGEINMYFVNSNRDKITKEHKQVMNYTGVKKMILEEQENKLSKSLTYHNTDHVKDVLRAATVLAKKENVEDRELILIQTAALFHDAGFMYVTKGHEEKSCELAWQYLPNYGYDTRQIEQICNMIMVTKLPQSPKNHLEEILADADLDYLGRDDFFAIGKGLCQEFMNRGKVNNEEEWNRLQVDFLENHHYFTLSAQKARTAKKEENLRQIKSKLKGL